MRFFWVMVCLLGMLSQGAIAGANPVYIGFDAEAGHKTSTSDDAIRTGIEIAIEEINARGGVLGGRPLQLIEKDNRSVPARGVENVRQFAGMNDLVAVFCGKFSPVALETLPVIHELKVPLLDPWAAADGIIDNDYSPSYAFRLSLKDSWALHVMLKDLQKRGFTKIGVMLPNNGWGRSSQSAIERLFNEKPSLTQAGTQWFNVGDLSLMAQYQTLRADGAQALILVANEKEGALLVREIASLPKDQRIPVASHWGVSGGDIAGLAGAAMQEVDFTLVQTFSFINNGNPVARRIGELAVKKLGKSDLRRVLSPVGIAHAYDLTHILALAVNQAGSTDRSKIRAALEKVRNYQGLIKHYDRPFAPGSHEALGMSDIFMSRYEGEGAPVPIGSRSRAR